MRRRTRPETPPCPSPGSASLIVSGWGAALGARPATNPSVAGCAAAARVAHRPRPTVSRSAARREGGATVTQRPDAPPPPRRHSSRPLAPWAQVHSPGAAAVRFRALGPLDAPDPAPDPDLGPAPPLPPGPSWAQASGGGRGRGRGRSWG